MTIQLSHLFGLNHRTVKLESIHPVVLLAWMPHGSGAHLSSLRHSLFLFFSPLSLFSLVPLFYVDNIYSSPVIAVATLNPSQIIFRERLRLPHLLHLALEERPSKVEQSLVPNQLQEPLPPSSSMSYYPRWLRRRSLPGRGLSPG